MDVENHHVLQNEKVRNGDGFHNIQREAAGPHEPGKGMTLLKPAGRCRPDVDGGYGWVIVIASFFVAFIVDGVGSSFGLLFPTILLKFGDSAFVTSFAGSLFVAFLIMGSASAALVQRFGFRVVTVIGSGLSCVAFVVASFSPNIYIFIVTYGLLAGCSCGLVFIPSIIIVNEYFHEKRGIANGIISSGSGVGLLVLAPIINVWLDTYLLDGTVLLLAGVLLNMCVFSCLFRPLPDNLIRPWDLNDKDCCSQPAVESLSSNLSSDNMDLAEVLEAKDCIVRQKYATQTCFDISEIVNWCHQTYLSSPVHDPSGVKSTFYVEYMLSHLSPAVLVPSIRCSTSRFGHGCIHQKSLSQHWPHENGRWRSDLQIDLTNVQPPTKHHRVHSIDDMHSCSHGKDDSQHKTFLRGPKQVQHHDQHKPHCSSHRQSQNLSIGHSSSFYLAGSITTLLNIHNSFLQTLQNSNARELHSSNFICKRLPENSALSEDRIMDCEQLLKPDGSNKSRDENFVKLVDIPGGDDQPASLQPKDLHKSVAKCDYPSFADGMTDSSMESEPLGYTISQLLCMPSFHLFCVGASLIQIGYPLAGTYLANYAYQFGLTTHHTAVLMSLLGGLNVCGRLLAGGLVSLKVEPLLLNNVSLLLGGVACLMSPLFNQFWSLCLFAGMFGFFLGFFPPLQPLIIVKYFGLESLASAFGFLSTVKGVASIVGAPLAGWIYDVTGQYSMSFMFGGVVFVLSSLVHCGMACVARCTSRNVRTV